MRKDFRKVINGLEKKLSQEERNAIVEKIKENIKLGKSFSAENLLKKTGIEEDLKAVNVMDSVASNLMNKLNRLLHARAIKEITLDPLQIHIQRRQKSRKYQEETYRLIKEMEEKLATVIIATAKQAADPSQETSEELARCTKSLKSTVSEYGALLKKYAKKERDETLSYIG